MVSLYSTRTLTKIHRDGPESLSGGQGLVPRISPVFIPDHHTVSDTWPWTSREPACRVLDAFQGRALRTYSIYYRWYDPMKTLVLLELQSVSQAKIRLETVLKAETTPHLCLTIQISSYTPKAKNVKWCSPYQEIIWSNRCNEAHEDPDLVSFCSVVGQQQCRLWHPTLILPTSFDVLVFTGWPQKSGSLFAP